MGNYYSHHKSTGNGLLDLWKQRGQKVIGKLGVEGGNDWVKKGEEEGKKEGGGGGGLLCCVGSRTHKSSSDWSLHSASLECSSL